MWQVVEASIPLKLSALLEFMERWSPGVTQDFAGAQAAQIRELAEPHGGVSEMPGVYLEFLERMGDSTGDLDLVCGSTSVGALLELRKVAGEDVPVPRRYVRYSVGEEDFEGEFLADFLDLATRTSSGADAAVLRVSPAALAAPARPPWRPFESFSDLLRSVTISRLCMEAVDRKEAIFGLGKEDAARVRCTEFLAKLGFELSDIGASPRVLPLEDKQRGAIASLSREEPQTTTLLYLRARDRVEELKLSELVSDHLPEILGR